MKAVRRLLSRLRFTLFGGNTDRDLAEEMESHIQLQAEENVRAGMNPAEARRAAVLKFGAVEAMKESYRDGRSLPFVEDVRFDVRLALRMLGKESWVYGGSSNYSRSRNWSECRRFYRNECLAVQRISIGRPRPANRLHHQP